MTVEFKYAIGSGVVIRLSDRTAEVRGLWINQDGVRYVLVRFSNTIGSIVERWEREDDLDISKH